MSSRGGTKKKTQEKKLAMVPRPKQGSLGRRSREAAMRAFFATPAEASLLFPPEEIPKLGSLQLDDDKLAYLYKLMNFKNIMTGRTNIELICADGENKLPWDRCFCSTLNKLDPFPSPPTHTN